MPRTAAQVKAGLRYVATPNGKARQRAAEVRYRQTAAGKASRRRQYERRKARMATA